MRYKARIGVVVVLAMLGVGKLYMNDSETVAQALVMEKYLKDYCRQHNRYPEYQTVETQFPQFYPNREWYYWPNETLSTATFQYPMTLPLSSAPGRSKLSEFLPLIYSYAYYHPCKGLIVESSRSSKSGW